MLVAAAIGMRCYADAVRTPAEFDFTHFETTIMQVLHLSRLLDPTAAPVAVICYVLYLYSKGHRYICVLRNGTLGCDGFGGKESVGCRHQFLSE